MCLSVHLPRAVAVANVNAAQVKELQSRFDQEKSAAGKLRVLDKLSEAQFAAATAADGKGDYNEIGLIFEKYRDNVRTVFDLLKQQEPNADKHSQGYRHLELQARRGIREVEDILVIVPGEVRPPLEIVRDDLIRTDDELIRLLFPRHSKDAEKAPPPATPPPGPKS